MSCRLSAALSSTAAPLAVAALSEAASRLSAAASRLALAALAFALCQPQQQHEEVAILRHLYRAGSQVVDRDTLLREIWGYNPAVTTHTLETHIYRAVDIQVTRLRRKLEDDPARAQLLVTEAGGYRLVP